MMNNNIYDLTFQDLSTRLMSWGQAPYRARQVWEGIYKHFWLNPSEYVNLPNTLRKRLSEEFIFNVLMPIRTLESSDGMTVKTLFQLSDHEAIEAVMMKYDRRRTLCISTQVGCAMGCVFCATGQMGFKRHLSSSEIIAQVIYYARALKLQGEVVTNVVIMGMGEPFHNYESTMVAIDRLNDPSGFNFGARRFTVSSVGLIPAIRRFTEEKRQVNLAISLHAADDSLRASMLPIARKYKLDDLLAACRDYTQITGRRISFEWALVNGVNDTPEQARLLASKLKEYFLSPHRGMLCHVNAIPLNPTTGYSGEATTRQRAQDFKNILVSEGINCTVRMRRGLEIQAGCGQLVNKAINE